MWPEWMVKSFPERPYDAGYRTFGDLREPTEEFWTKNDVTHKAKVVCKLCNNGWMSLLEQETIPILKPMITNPRGARRLNMHQQGILANWTTLRLMIFDRVRDSDSKYFSNDELIAFATPSKRKPITHTHVWLATLPDMGGMGVHAGIHCRGTATDPWRYSVFNCVFGQIALQVFHWSGFTADWIGNADRSAAINLRKLNDPIWQKATVRVWPRRSNLLSWPPQQSLALAGISPFYNRFYIPTA